MTPNIYCLLGIKLRAKENELKEMQRIEKKANNFIEKRKERIMLDLTILLDMINIRPGRDLTQK